MTWLYLPITSQPRELDSKLLLAHFAAEAGLRPVLGYKSKMLTTMPKLRPGVFLAHNARQKVHKLAQAQRFGNAVVVLDEEALVRQTDEIFWKKHDQGAFEHVDSIMAWGEDDAAIWPRYGAADPDAVSIVGNPRFDLLRPELAPYFATEVAQLHERFGRYVLLNTNFPTVNNLTPQGGGVRMAKWAMDQAGQDLNDRFLDFKKSMFQDELDLIAPLARAIAPLSLVVRPHPNEDHAPWHAAARGEPNVHITFEGNVVPWLLGAEALVHNNCTTGVEGVAAGKQVLNFVPFRSEFDNPLFHAFGTDCSTANQIASAISASDQEQVAKDRETLRHHVVSVSDKLSCERIVDLVASGSIGATTRRNPGPIVRHSAGLLFAAKRQERLLSYRVSKSGRAKRQFLKERYPQIKPSNLDHDQLGYSIQQLDLMMRQFPPLDLADVNDRLARFAAALGRPKSFNASPLHDDLITVG